MTRLAVVGTGYVGTVTAVCLSWLGHEVVGLDLDASRVDQLSRGQVPFYEPGLDELLRTVLATGRLSFTADGERAARGAAAMFLCVGTPPGRDGIPNMSQVEGAARTIAAHLQPGSIVVNKSTVPVGSGNWVRTLIEEALGHRVVPFEVVSNPEFLREGSAVEDFLFPDRIVLGGENGSPDAVARIYERVLHQNFDGGRPDQMPHLVVTSLASAEMVKYAANAFLATKISFANEIANICELVGADAREVLPAIGSDRRIGRAFLQHGVGWGGSCFGKDIAALIATGLDYGYSSPILRASVEVNQGQRAGVLRKLQASLKVLKGRRIGVLGLAFKPGTDDLRDAPAIEILRRLHGAGCVVSAYDPVVARLSDDDAVPVRIAAHPYDAAQRANAVVITTEWPEFAALDLPRLAEAMTGRLVLDGRGVLDPNAAARAGLVVSGFGW